MFHRYLLWIIERKTYEVDERERGREMGESKKFRKTKMKKKE